MASERITLVVAPTTSSEQEQETDEPTLVEVNADILSDGCVLFREMLDGSAETVISIDRFSAEAVESCTDLLAVLSMSLCKTSARFKELPLDIELIELVAPVAEFWGATRLMEEIVGWVQRNASVRAVACIEGLAGGTFHVDWSDAAMKVLLPEVTAPTKFVNVQGNGKVNTLKPEALQRLRKETILAIVSLHNTIVGDDY